MWTWIVALAAVSIVGNTNSRVVLEFGSRKCPACQQMQPAIDRLVSEDQWIVRYIDTDRESALVERWRVHQTPTLIVVENGREVDRILKNLTYEQLKARLEGRDEGSSASSFGTSIERQGSANRGFAGNGSGIASSSSGLASGPSAVVRGQSPSSSANAIAPGLVPIARSVVQANNLLQGGDPEVRNPAARDSQRNNRGAEVVVQESPTDPQGSTVRIRVDDGKSESVGTGTIIDSVGSEALVLTCGHLFRDSQGTAKIQVEIFHQGRAVPVEAKLVDYHINEKVDIGLISFRTAYPVPIAKLLPRAEKLREGQRVFSYGCDRGADPSRRDTQISKLNRYLGAPNVEISGAPVQGRSGGGLFDDSGRLIGVCFAADPELDEGLYSGPEVVYQQLERLGLKRLYDDVGRGASNQIAREDLRGPANGNANRPTNGSVRSNPSSASVRPVVAPKPTREIFAVVREPGKEDQILSLNEAPSHVVQLIQEHGQEISRR